jgi:membrane protein DedA with SNARE-associated domain
MSSHLLTWLSLHIIAVISHLGYLGVALLMAIESACVPLPSEVILPCAGYLAFTGRFELYGVVMAAAVGCCLGSLFAYAIGYYGGRPLALRYGRWVLLVPGDLERAEGWVGQRGGKAVFVCRMLPVVQTFIALPAGIVRMPLPQFQIATALGSLIWGATLSSLGYHLGANWERLDPYFRRFDIIWTVVMLGGATFVVWHHVHRWRRAAIATPQE